MDYYTLYAYLQDVGGAHGLAGIEETTRKQGWCIWKVLCMHGNLAKAWLGN